jgi:hypothetical protein
VLKGAGVGLLAKGESVDAGTTGDKEDAIGTIEVTAPVGVDAEGMSVEGTDGTADAGTNVVPGPKMGAAVVGWFVGLLDGPAVHVGLPVSVRSTEGCGDWPVGTSEVIGSSTGDNVVGLLVGVLDGEKLQEGLGDSVSTVDGRGTVLGGSDNNV